MRITRSQGTIGFGAKARAGDCSTIVARQPAFSVAALTGRGFRWVLPEAWDDAQTAAFLRLRTAPAAPLYGSTPYVDARRREIPVVVGRWLLVLDEETTGGGTVAAAEVQWSPGLFAKALLLVSSCDAPDGWNGVVASSALVMMASAALLTTSADLMLLVGLSEATQEALTARSWGEAADLRTVRTGDDGLPYLMRASARRVDAWAWWQHPDGSSSRATLAWLDKRVNAEQEKAKPRLPPRPNFLQRLNRLLRWS